MVKTNGRNRMLTASEVAHLLNIHINTVRRWSDNGVLRAYRIGTRGDRRFDPNDIAQFLNNNGAIVENSNTT
jgi:excisionase family DNA binding protein